MYIRLRTGQIFYLNKKVRDRYNAWVEFCSKYLHKPRDKQFYKDFLEYLKNN